MNDGSKQLAAAERPKQLAVVGERDYLIQSFDQDDFRRTIEANLGGEPVSEYHLVKARVPSGGGSAWNIQSHAGESSENELVGVISAHQTRRSYWSKGIGEGGQGPPDCWSSDGIRGHGTEAKSVQGALCHHCPKSQFNTARGPDGKLGRGQACGKRKTLFLITKKSILPMCVSLPPTSLAAFSGYALELTGKKMPISSVETRMTIVRQKSAGGISFAVVKFEVVRSIDPEQAKRFADFGEVYKKLFTETPTPTETAAEVTLDGVPVDDNPNI